MRDPVTVANTLQSYIPRLSRCGRASDVSTKGFNSKRVIRAKPCLQRGATLIDWPPVNMTPPAFRPIESPLCLTPVPACNQVF